MMTFTEIRDAVAKALRDPSKVTFHDDGIAAMVNMGMTEIGRIAPRRFDESISPVADTTDYVLQSDYFAGVTVPEIEVARVEIWDRDATPNRAIRKVESASASYTNYSEAGWKIWDGVLQLPTWVPIFIGDQISRFDIRVWGYAPYKPLVYVTDDDAITGLSSEREQALITFCRVEGLRQLMAERDLFSQWQAAANNTDMTPAGLMNALSLATQDWNRLARSIAVLREGAG